MSLSSESASNSPVDNFQSNAKIFPLSPLQIVVHLPTGTKIAATVRVRTRPSPRTPIPATKVQQTSTNLKVPSSSSNHCRKVHYDAVLLQLSVSNWPTTTAMIRTIWTTTFCHRQGPHRKNVTLNLMTSGASASSVTRRASSVSVRTNSTAPSVSLYLPSSTTMMPMCLLLPLLPVKPPSDDIAFPSTENNATDQAEQINPRLMPHYPTRPIVKSSIRAGNPQTTSL